MDHEEMARFCQESHFLMRAYLKDYKFVYDGYSITRKGAVANIISSPGDKVWGGIYEITDSDLEVLNKKEGLPKTYQRGIFKVIDDKQVEYEAVIFSRVGQVVGRPNKIYRDIVIKGASDCRLPVEYIDTVY